MVGKTVSHYKILEKLGEGGMGVVFKAEDLKLDRVVALKFLPPDLTRDPEAKQRFIHEAKAASALQHNNICVIHDIDETPDGQLFICMEHLDGETLKAKIERGPLKKEEIADIAAQIAQGLAKAHEAGIVHRDIKPANIIITSDGIAKVVDFGLAKLVGQTKLTHVGSTIGTVAYMSPEQSRGEEVDARTDIWSLGVILYEMLTGQLPFKGEYDQVVFFSILTQEPQDIRTIRSDVSLELDGIVRTCLQKEIANRYHSAGELAGHLRRLISGGTATQELLRHPTVSSTVARHPVYRSILVLAVILLLLVALIPSVRHGVLSWMGRGIPHADKHLAVLPFSNIGGDQANQTFCDGLVEILVSNITRLQQFDKSFWVVAYSEIRKENVTSASEAHTLFGATLACTGSVQRTHDEVTVTVNLVDALTLRQLQSEIIKVRLDSLMDLQDNILRKLAEALGIALPPGASGVSESGHALSSRAYDYYLQGRGRLQRSDKSMEIDTAIALFSRAVHADSTFALAYAGLGEAYWTKYNSSKDLQWVAPAMSNSARALALDTSLAAVHVTMGLIDNGTGRYDDAVIQNQEAIRLDPLNSDALEGLAGSYANLQDFQRADSLYRRAVDIRPSYWEGYNSLGVFYYSRGRYEDAIVQFRKVVDLTPDNNRGYSNLGAIYFYLGRNEEAQAMFERSIEIKPSYAACSNLGTLYYNQGRFRDAARMYEDALKINDNDYSVWGNLGSAYSEIPGQREKDIACKQKAIEIARKQLAVNPEDPELVASLAGYYGDIGDSARAISSMQEALALAPHDADVMFRAGCLYEQLGQRDKAFDWIAEAIRQGHSYSEIERTPALRDFRKDKRYSALAKHR
jgi:serine/threonine protein kinase/tetratricopeptide (TPR) repeat protein